MTFTDICGPEMRKKDSYLMFLVLIIQVWFHCWNRNRTTIPILVMKEHLDPRMVAGAEIKVQIKILGVLNTHNYIYTEYKNNTCIRITENF